ncbi:hypothetical protein I316_02710 [Kwoniella heveanensis BCC8398]|uniref:Uncharacterized protein n=1 Tax=Kwoniella heveanensis BCC8398 TaxID=1296120 RepID=A0A1B9GXI4_9TREE|nr:hypothetical protein I316_02710 [Kwoniella heveanensis BCC8398]
MPGDTITVSLTPTQSTGSSPIAESEGITASNRLSAIPSDDKDDDHADSPSEPPGGIPRPPQDRRPASGADDADNGSLETGPPPILTVRADHKARTRRRSPYLVFTSFDAS